MLWSRLFFGRLRQPEVPPEPTPAPTQLGRLRLQSKKGRLQAAPTPDTKMCHFELTKRLNSNILFWIIFIFKN